MKGQHPDNAMSDIAYEKRLFFLRMIEENVGRESTGYVLKNISKTISFKLL